MVQAGGQGHKMLADASWTSLPLISSLLLSLPKSGKEAKPERGSDDWKNLWGSGNGISVGLARRCHRVRAVESIMLEKKASAVEKFCMRVLRCGHRARGLDMMWLGGQVDLS